MLEKSLLYINFLWPVRALLAKGSNPKDGNYDLAVSRVKKQK
jgi:hypothetical protein